MGIAALVVAGLLGLVLAVAIIYGTCLVVYRGGRFLWRLLVVEEPAEAPSATQTSGPACWEDKECPQVLRDACPAYTQRDKKIPCWLANLQAEGRLRVSCLTCSRFDVKELVA